MEFAIHGVDICGKRFSEEDKKCRPHLVHISWIVPLWLCDGPLIKLGWRGVLSLVLSINQDRHVYHFKCLNTWADKSDNKKKKLKLCWYRQQAYLPSICRWYISEAYPLTSRTLAASFWWFLEKNPSQEESRNVPEWSERSIASICHGLQSGRKTHPQSFAGNCLPASYVQRMLADTTSIIMTKSCLPKEVYYRNLKQAVENW